VSTATAARTDRERASTDDIRDLMLASRQWALPHQDES